jgi:hypothetical protein
VTKGTAFDAARLRLHYNIAKQAERLAHTPQQAFSNLNNVGATLAAVPPAGVCQAVLGQGAQGWVLKTQLLDGAVIARKVRCWMLNCFALARAHQMYSSHPLLIPHAVCAAELRPHPPGQQLLPFLGDGISCHSLRRAR